MPEQSCGLRGPRGLVALVVVRTRRDASGVVIMVATVVALVLRGYHLTRPGILFGMGGDDGVYFGAAVRLVHGVLPYRDYVLVHPPLIAVLLAPFAGLAEFTGTADAFALARLATVVVGAAGVLLMGRLLRCFGTRSVLVGCVVLALNGSAISSAQTVLLEPYVVLTVLAGLLVLFDGTHLATPRRQIIGSALIGLACAIKIWVIVPAVVLAAVAVLFPASDGRRRGQLGRVASGVTVGFLLPVLPFAAAAPTRFMRDVFVTQAQRQGMRTSAPLRVASLLGLGQGRYWTSGAVLVVGAALVLLLVAVYAWWARRGGGQWDAFTVFAVVSAALVAVMFFIPDSYYWHYGGFFAPFLGLTLALPASQYSAVTWRPVRSAVALVVGAFMVVSAASAGAALAPADRTPIPVAAIDAVIPPGACVLTNRSSLLLVTGRFTGAPSCPQVIDPVGVHLVYTHGLGFDQQLRAHWVALLARSRYLLVTADKNQLPWGRLRPIVERDFHPVDLSPTSPLSLWQRDTGPALHTSRLGAPLSVRRPP